MKTDKIMELPEDKEYIISGTIEEMIAILNTDFGLDNTQARFIIYIETLEKKERIEFEERELKLWYLNEQTPNTSPIFHLPYTISITKLKLEMHHSLFIFLGTFLFSKEVSLVALGLDLIWALKEAIQKIDTDEFCVYGLIVDYVFSTQKETFLVDDIIPYDENQECNRKPDTWKCPYWNSDRCSLTNAFIDKKLLEKLVKKGVLTRVGKYFKMVK